MNKDVVRTSLSLIKEKIIKTDTVLNIVCERNATIAELQSKLDLISAKFIAKCENLSVLEEQRDSKDKQIYSLTTRLVQLQGQYDQLAFDSNFAQSQSNEKYVDSFLVIQNLESELIKLNGLVNKLGAENDLFKEQNGGQEIYKRTDAILKAKVKDLKGKLHLLEDDIKLEKRHHNLCQKDLLAARNECERLDSIFNTYKINFKQFNAIEKCLTCSKNTPPKNDGTLFNSILDIQKEKYDKLHSQFEQLEISVYKLKKHNVEVAEKYSNLLLTRENDCKIKKIDVSSQTVENKTISDKKGTIQRGIDVITEENLRIKQLTSENRLIKEQLTKTTKEKSILRTDCNNLLAENKKIHNKYDALLLEKEILSMENESKPTLVSIDTQTCFFLQENDLNLEKIVNSNFDFDDLGLDLSSDSEYSFSEDILEEMIKLPQIISPIPEIKIKPSNLIENIDYIAVKTKSDSLPLSCVKFDCCNNQNVNKACSNNESTQTDFDLCVDNSKLNKFDFGCQAFLAISSEDRGIQCSKKYINLFARKSSVKRKINKSAYKCNFKTKFRVKMNLKAALGVFRKYAISMSFENGNLLSFWGENKFQMSAINCFLFRKSNRLLRRFCSKFRDLKVALNIANRYKLTAEILNGLICDKKLIEDNKFIDKQIDDIVSNSNFNKSRQLIPILDDKDDLKGFGSEIDSLKRKKQPQLKKRRKEALNKFRKIRKQRLNDLRTKFELAASIIEINDQNVAKNTKFYFTSSSGDSRDNNSVDSGYTDGSLISENNSIVTRFLRSSDKKRKSDTLHYNVNLTNKRRKKLENDLFGSDDSDDDIVEKLVVQKSPVKKRKASRLDKMRQTIIKYNPVARSDSKSTCETIDDSRHLENVVKEQKTARKSVKKSKQNLVEEVLQEKQHDKVHFEHREEIIKLNSVKSINKEDLMQRFISDIPVINVAENRVFKKALPRPKINLQNDSDDDLLVSTKNVLNDVVNNEVISQKNTGLEDDTGIKLLNRLIQYNCEEKVISDVCSQLKQTSTKQISRLIIHCLYKFRCKATQPSHTPLAPDLSAPYKTLIGFANILITENHENIFTELLDQLEIRFLLQNNASAIKKLRITENGAETIQGVIPTYSVISLEQMYRFYVSVCMLRTEVLRLRLFLCDLAFYQRDGWYGLMYAVFTIWPAVLPKHLNEENEPTLKENDELLMKVLMFFVFKKRNSNEYMYYRPFLTTFALGYYKYTYDNLHMNTIFDELVVKFTTSESNIIALALRILLQRITNADLMELLRSESFNKVFTASDEEALIGKSKLLWLVDKIIPEIKIRGDATIIRGLQNILEKLLTRVENEKVKNFIHSCISKLTS